MKKLFKQHNREMSLVIAIAVMFLIFGLINSIYVSPDNIIDIINQATIYGLMAVGITGIIISGGIDLSVGSALALIAVVVGNLAVSGVHPIFCLIIGLMFGFILGLINGVLVAKLSLQPFIATLGTMSIYRGAAYLLTSGIPVLGVPESFRRFTDGQLFWFIRVSVIIFFLFAVFAHIVLKKIRLGNYIYAIGGNEEAARLSGVKVDLNKIMIYAIGMMGTALAAMIQLGKLGTGDPTTGQGYELNAIAAAAIGGTSMAGGRGSIIGTVLGAILFAGLKIGLIVAGVDTFWQYVATGLVIIIAAYIEVVQDKISLAAITKRTAK